MRMPVPAPSAKPLPFRPGDATPRSSYPPPRCDATLPLRGTAVARFDGVLHQLNPEAVRVDIDRMQHLLVWLLTLSEEDARGVLDRRLRRIDELRAMLGDADWDADDAMRARLGKLFDYIDRDADLSPDHEPLLGVLDDALLIELAWPAFAEEVVEYRDFCAYRNEEHPVGGGAQQRMAWIRDRQAEIALLQHHVRVHGSHYIERGHPEGLFRVA